MMEGEQDAFSESKGIFKGKEPRIKKGISAGRVVNILATLNYFLIFLTALIVTGIFGVLNKKLTEAQYATNSNGSCILFSKCVPHGGDHCDIEYNGSGACEFIAAGFGIVALVGLAYMIVSIVRIVLSTNIWWSVIADMVSNIGVLLGVMVMGITLSVGLAITCSSATDSKRINHTSSCSASEVPMNNGSGYHFYGKVNASQGAAWFCFMFVVFSLVVSLVRLCIMIRRKAKVPAIDDREILTAEDKPV